MNHIEALKLLRTYTAGRFDVWALAGNSKASCRAHIMSTLTGVKVPQSKAGVNAIRDAFHAIAKPEGNCIYAREKSFVAWAQSQLA